MSAHAPTGVGRWLFSTNHKDIGTLYIIFGSALFFVGGFMALIIRTELFIPGLQFVTPNFFNQMTTMHGLIMLLLVVMPMLTGIANWMIPLMIGAPDMALPRLNNMSFWLLPFAALIAVSTMFMPGGGPNFGWTFYAPLSTTYAPPSLPFFVFSVHIMGMSSILASINVIATVFNMRAPGMSFMKMPVLVWTFLVMAFLLLAIMPVLAAAVTMVLTDAYFGTHFFSAGGGGDPLLFQHLFWFFGHPEVYVIILPAFGIISTILPTFARKPLFGYASMVYAIVAIAFISFVVWAHHMFTVGLPLAGEIFFTVTTLAVAVPTGIKVFNWIATIYQGSISFETPMLFSIAFVVLFTIGGFTGLMVAVSAADFQYHDSYFVVAHFHYVLVPGAVFAITAGIYYWLPKWSGHMYNETLGKVHFWLSFISVNVTFFPQHFVGLAGMPRRIPDYALQFTDFNMLSSVGAFVFGLSQLIMLYNIVISIRSGSAAEAKPWDGADGLEWTVPSPAPYHTFETPPVVK